MTRDARREQMRTVLNPNWSFCVVKIISVTLRRTEIALLLWCLLIWGSINTDRHDVNTVYQNLIPKVAKKGGKSKSRYWSNPTYWQWLIMSEWIFFTVYGAVLSIWSSRVIAARLFVPQTYPRKHLYLFFSCQRIIVFCEWKSLLLIIKSDIFYLFIAIFRWWSKQPSHLKKMVGGNHR